MDKKLDFITECARMLQEKAVESGYSSISPETMRKIMALYIAEYYSNMPKTNTDNVIELHSNFANMARKNKENEERLRKERIAHNKKVLKAYRIKPS